MLSTRQNFLETIHGGKPDRFVNQYEFLTLLMGEGYRLLDPINQAYPGAAPGAGPVKGAWGITAEFREGQPGPMPLHGDYTVIKDITKWRDYVVVPKMDYPASAWEEGAQLTAAVDKKETFAASAYFNGVFEKVHYLMGMEEALLALYEEPECMHELIDCITDFEVKYAELVTRYWKPDALFHHDDWGSHISTYMSVEMFREFIKPAYMKIYKTYKENGVELIVHHSDSYAATLVPDMIDMGVDVYQGCVSENNVPELVKKYGGKISFMGDLNNGVLDKVDWTPELVRKEVERACRNNGKLYFIPCLTMGGPGSSYPGVYETVTEEIKRMSKEMF